MRAVIPVVFYWDDPQDPVSVAYDNPVAMHAERERHALGGSGLTHNGPPPWVLWWLKYRRERWMHDARVRG